MISYRYSGDPLTIKQYLRIDDDEVEVVLMTTGVAVVDGALTGAIVEDVTARTGELDDVVFAGATTVLAGVEVA